VVPVLPSPHGVHPHVPSVAALAAVAAGSFGDNHHFHDHICQSAWNSGKYTPSAFTTVGTVIEPRQLNRLFDELSSRSESCPGQGLTWQDGVAAVGSFGFKVTTSLWHWSRFESEDR
jgi:hypothetical protein